MYSQFRGLNFRKDTTQGLEKAVNTEAKGFHIFLKRQVTLERRVFKIFRDNPFTSQIKEKGCYSLSGNRVDVYDNFQPFRAFML